MARHSKFHVDFSEWMFVLALGIMGLLFSARPFLVFLDKLNPLAGLLVYYVIMYSALFLLSLAGLVIWKFRIQNPVQVLGTTLVTFAFFITVDWESPLIEYMVHGAYPTVSNIYFQSEDGAMFWIWNTLFGITNASMLRLLVYVVSPVLIALLGVYLISKVDIKS